MCPENCVSTMVHGNLVFKMWKYGLSLWVCTKTDNPGSPWRFNWLSTVLLRENKIWKWQRKYIMTRQTSLRTASTNCPFNCNDQNGIFWKLVTLLSIERKQNEKKKNWQGENVYVPFCQNFDVFIFYHKEI